LVDLEKIHEQYFSSDPKESVNAIEQLEDKIMPLISIQKTWEDYYRLIVERTGMPCPELEDLASVFSHLPNKHHIYEDLHRLIDDKSYDVRYRAIYALCSVFSQLPDRQQAWADLDRQLSDEDRFLRCSAAGSFRFAFPYVPDKQQAWDDLSELLYDEFWYVRDEAVKTLKFVYSYVPDKLMALFILVIRTSDREESVRLRAASALNSVFALVPDKQIAWEDLHRLSNDQDRVVRYRVVFVLGSVFALVQDKQTAWEDLHRLSNDQDSGVRSHAASAIGSVFALVQDKQTAWDDLVRMTSDKEKDVRTYANHSLGKISIIKASQSEKEEEYKEELEKAIWFFDKAANESTSWNNPSQFCLPFYNSFYSIIFKRNEAKAEVDKYLVDAKAAIVGSKNKELLCEAVNNLAEALKEVQNLENIDVLATQEELNLYRKYCDHAAELLTDTNEKAPYATEVLRKGLPILDRFLKALLKEIQEKAKTACKESIGTPTQEIACTVNKEIQKWEIGNQEEMSWYVNSLVIVLKSKIPNNPENKGILDMIEYMKCEKDLTKQYRTLSNVIGLIPTVNVISDQELDKKLDKKLQKFDFIFDEIIFIRDKLNCISFDISKLKLNSTDVILGLKTMKEEIEKLNKTQGLNTVSIENLNTSQKDILNELNNNILEILNEIGILANKLPNKEDAQKILDSINKLKQSKPEMLFQKSVDIISLIGFAIEVFPYLHL
jgi:HEAT repeat protein